MLWALWALVILGVIIVLLLFLLARLFRKYIDTSRQYSDLSGRYASDIEAARAESVRRSRAVHLGGIAEQLAPLLPDFPYDPKDCRWAGQPIDMIVFDGLEGGGDVSIVLLEVKTGTSSLKGNQRQVRDAVDAGRVQFRVYRPDRQWASVAVETTEPEPALAADEDEEPKPDWDSLDLAEIEQALPDEEPGDDWESAITDVTVAADPPLGRQRARKNQGR
jgi:predicted Holliday junction resolvase-like endonuclease